MRNCHFYPQKLRVGRDFIIGATVTVFKVLDFVDFDFEIFYVKKRGLTLFFVIDVRYN